MSDKTFLEEIEVSPGFDRTMELKWFRSWWEVLDSDGSLIAKDGKLVLCQKWHGAFRDVWVRVPISQAESRI